MKRCLLFLFVLMCGLSAHAEFGFFGTPLSSIRITRNGTVETSTADVFNNRNLGVVETLFLNGGTIQTFKNSGGNVCSGIINYRIYPQGGTVPGFTTFNLPFSADLGNGDQKWETFTGNTNLTTGLSAGNYVFEIYFSITGHPTTGSCTDTRFQNSGGANYKATFTLANVSVGSGNFSNPSVWSTATAPQAGQSVIIKSGHHITLNTDATISSIDINSGATFTASDATARTLTISNGSTGTHFTNNGTFNPATGTVLFVSTANMIHSVGGSTATTFYNTAVGRTTPTDANTVGLQFAANSTVANSFTINRGGYVNVTPPAYSTGSTLVYNTGTNFGASSEWKSNATSGPGVPYNVEVLSGTSLNFGSANEYRQANGNFVNGAGSTLTLSTIAGGDLKVAGDYTNAGNIINNNSRAVFFVGANRVQTVQRTGGDGIIQFAYLINAQTGNASLQFLSDVIINNNITMEPGTVTDINGKTFTLNGGVVNSGVFKGSPTSKLVLRSATGTFSFSQATTDAASLQQLTVENGGSATLGAALHIYNLVNVTGNGTLNLAGRNLVLKSTPTLTSRVGSLAAGTITNATNVTVERNIGEVAGRRAWRLMTAPLSGSTNNSVFTTWQNSKVYTPGVGTHITGTVNPTEENGLDAKSFDNSLKVYNGTELVGVNNTKTESLFSAASAGAAGNRGFFLFVRGDRDPRNLTVPNFSATTLKATGTLQTGTLTVPTNPTAEGLALVGNPYASPVDLVKIHNQNSSKNLKSNFYYWDPSASAVGAYVTVQIEGNSVFYSGAGNRTTHIQSGQAFFVQAKSTPSGESSITFNEDQKSAENLSSLFRQGNHTETFGLNLYLLNTNGNKTLVDAILAKYNNLYSPGVNDEDAYKLNNVDESVSFLRNGTALSIEGRPLIDDADTLFVQMRNLKVGRNYEWVFAPTNFNAPGLTAFLEDSYLNTSTQISLNDSSLMTFSTDSEAASRGLSRFRVVFTTSGVLPVYFTTVKAAQKDRNIQVEWKVATESGIAQYEVEKSTDGRNYTKVSQLAAKGISGSAYNWLDIQPAAGNNFYRIKAIDQLGSSVYSSAVKVQTGRTASQVVVYPNPVKGTTISLQFVQQPAGNYTIRMFSKSGQLVYNGRLAHAGGSSTQTIHLPKALPQGMYELQVAGSETQTTQQVIVQ